MFGVRWLKIETACFEVLTGYFRGDVQRYIIVKIEIKQRKKGGFAFKCREFQLLS